MKIEIVIDEKQFDEQIGNIIKAKVRNDKRIAQLIEEELHREIEKKVATAFIISDFDEVYLRKRVEEIFNELKTKATNTLAAKLQTIIQPLQDVSNRKVLEKLFAGEIKQIKTQSKRKKK